MMGLSHGLVTGAIFALGACTIVLSVIACIKFGKYTSHLRKPGRDAVDNNAGRLTNAISWQLAGEAVIGAGTLMFAAAEFLGFLSKVSWGCTSLLRFVMFVATSATTLHLVRVIIRNESRKQ